MSSTLYPPPSAFTNGRLSKRASAILNGANPSVNSLNLLELDELLGWAESAKSTPHQSTALDELDKLLGEFNIESVDRLEKRIAEARPQFNRTNSFHTSENDIRSNVQMPSAIAAENRVFSEPRFETCANETFTPEKAQSLTSPSIETSPPPANDATVRMDDIMNKEYPPELLHNFFGRRNITDDRSELSSVTPHKPISHTPSVCSSRYSNSFSSSEKASNYTMFSQQHRRDLYTQLPGGKYSSLLSQSTRNDMNTMRGNGTLRSQANTLRSNCTTLRSNGGTLRQNSGSQPLKSGRRKKRCKFLLCTPV